MIKINDTIRVVPGYRRDIPVRHVPITRQLAVAPTAEIDRHAHLPIDEYCNSGGCLELETEDGCPLFDRACSLYGEPVSNIRWIRIGADTVQSESTEDLSTLEDQASDPVTDAEAENDPEYEQWCEGFRV